MLDHLGMRKKIYKYLGSLTLSCDYQLPTLAQGLRIGPRYLMHHNRGIFMRLPKFSVSNASKFMLITSLGSSSKIQSTSHGSEEVLDGVSTKIPLQMINCIRIDRENVGSLSSVKAEFLLPRYNTRRLFIRRYLRGISRTYANRLIELIAFR